ncbi:DNA polymerase III subunit gamma/tau [Persicitalea jodogahamensis]|uniref:DNA polymerase III subunit gamma/tau n=1 Tax=Persicitalea jodogahamensis TaxID=402147 RepID=A0A8J3GBF7_9BACT|nr:DNA polymerase III subunit gamma/tau [Persicitalea jodogahamensis]GHB77103.1 DNA polymerase III subunit gamma/tau [Persicitalea jodogahamensis]
MEHFVVSARKYRPVTFDSVVGQSHITTTLKNAIRTNHLAQAFLFCGPRGVGKTTCARILAKTINCQNLSDDVEPCGECESCVSFQNNASFNIHELDAASNNSVDDIRNLIDQVRYPPQTGKYKIYIIDEVHMLSPAAFNAFLKTLEEPPSYAIFILATTEKHKILPTILSRCQIFDFNRIRTNDIADHLEQIARKEGIIADREALELIGRKADGGLRDALSMFDLNVTFSPDNELSYTDVLENLHILDYDYYFKITDALLKGSIAESLLLFDEIVRKGFDGHLFIIGLLEHLRNLLVTKDPITVSLLEVSEVARNKYLDQSQRSGMSFLLSAMSVGSQCDIHYKTSKNQRLHVELCLMKMAKLPDLLSLQALPINGETGAEVKKKAESGTESGVALTTESPSPAYEAKPTAQVASVDTPSAAPTVTPSLSTHSKLRSTAHITTPSTEVPAITTQVLEKTESPQPVEKREKLPLTYDNLYEFWGEFARKRKIERDSATEELIFNREFKLDGQVIRIALDNELQKEAMAAIRNELIQFLRERIEAPLLSLDFPVNQQAAKKVAYTDKEKFAVMAEKNPHLLELQQLLGLDIEF